MSAIRSAVVSPKRVKVLAAIVVGLGVGTAVPPKPVSLPVVGPTSGVVVGGVGILVGAVLYLRVPDLVRSPDAGDSSGCGCAGNCECS